MLENFYLEWDLVPIYFFGILAGFLVLALAIITHELGHLLYFYMIGKKVKLKISNWIIYVGNEGDYAGLTENQYKMVNFMGILFGAIIILSFGTIMSWMFWLIVPYLWGCRSDISELLDLNDTNL